ncbi:MAG: hypothetical protein ABSC18_10115 [Verrucomicrobiota bacterium]
MRISREKAQKAQKNIPILCFLRFLAAKVHSGSLTERAERDPSEAGLCSCVTEWMRYFPRMSFSEVLAELPALTVSERQLLVRRALDLDEPGLSAKDEALVEKRLEDHRRNPDSAVPLKEMKARLRSRFRK